MQHDLDRIVLRVVLVALAPVVTNGIGEDAAILVERGGGDAAADGGVALESVLCVLVPEMERSVRASRTESAVLGMEGNVIHGVNVGDVVLRCISVTLE